MININTNIQLANENLYLNIDKKTCIYNLDIDVSKLILLYSKMFHNKFINENIFKQKLIDTLFSILNGIDINNKNIYNVLDNIDNDIISHKYTCYYEDNILYIKSHLKKLEQGISDIIYALSEALYLMFKYYEVV